MKNLGSNYHGSHEGRSSSTYQEGQNQVDGRKKNSNFKSVFKSFRDRFSNSGKVSRDGKAEMNMCGIEKRR